MPQTVGYFKPASQVPRQRMGWTTALGENGSTLAAAIETDEAVGVEVFRKSSAGWAYETQLLGDPRKQDPTNPADPAVAISGAGDVVALGVDVEIRPDAPPEDDLGTGSVYVFRRTPTGWIREQKLTFPDSRPDDRFGLRVGLDESGTLLVAWRRFGDLPEGAPVRGFGVVELFRHTTAGWTRTTVPADGVGCSAMALSGDGNTLVRGCGNTDEVLMAPDWHRVASFPTEVFNTVYSIEPRVMAVSHDGRSFAARSVTLNEDGSQAQAWVNVYRLGAAGWAREATLARPGNFPHGDPSNPDGGFGLALSLSRDGRFLAVGGSGAGVYVFERKSTGWSLRRNLNQLTPGNPDSLFGWSVSFARNGKDLAVAAPWDPSSTAGIGGDPVDTSAPFRGAVWLY